MAGAFFTPKQYAYWNNANHRWNIKFGATRSGKTFLDYYMLPKRIRGTKGDGLTVILGTTQATIERNLLQPMRQMYGQALVPESIAIDGGIKLFGKDVYIIGAEKRTQVSKIQGQGIEYAYGDEITTWSHEVWQMLTTRLDKPHSRFDGTCNPTTPTHWLKQFIDNPELDVYAQQYRITDNTKLHPDVITAMKAELAGTVYYHRFINGEWTAAEGVVYPNFDADKFVVPTKDRNYSRYVVSIDYGTNHPCVFGLFGYMPAEDRWYMVREYYHNGAQERQKTVGEYYRDLQTFTGGLDISKVYLDNAPIASSFNIYLRKQGDYSSRLADNAVEAGIQSVATALNKGKIYFNDCCKNTIREFSGYRWNEKADSDKPIKEDDDCMDMLRYFIHTHRVGHVPLQTLSQIYGI